MTRTQVAKFLNLIQIKMFHDILVVKIFVLLEYIPHIQQNLRFHFKKLCVLQFLSIG